MKITNTKDVTTNRFIGLIVGRSGCGKTYQCRYLDEDTTLILSAESGLLCLKGTKFDVVNIKTMDELTEAYLNLSKGTKYKTIFIDSLTEIAEVCLKNIKARASKDDLKNGFKVYGDYGDQLGALIKAFRDLDQYSVIMTCLTADVKDGLEIRKEYNFPGEKVKNNIKSWMDEVLHLEVKEVDGVKKRYFVTDDLISPLAKDRSGTLDQYEEANIGNVMKKVLQ